jgi:hypothetical protein
LMAILLVLCMKDLCSSKKKCNFAADFKIDELCYSKPT